MLFAYEMTRWFDFSRGFAMRWFKPVGLLFMPSSAPGWIVCGGALAFCANVFWAIDRQTHSVSDTLYGIFPFWMPTFLAVAWIADRTGGRAA